MNNLYTQRKRAKRCVKCGNMLQTVRFANCKKCRTKALIYYHKKKGHRKVVRTLTEKLEGAK